MCGGSSITSPTSTHFAPGLLLVIWYRLISEPTQKEMLKFPIQASQMDARQVEREPLPAEQRQQC